MSMTRESRLSSLIQQSDNSTDNQAGLVTPQMESKSSSPAAVFTATSADHKNEAVSATRPNGGSAKTLYQQAEAHYQKKEYLKAITCSEEAIQADPSFAEAYYRRAAAREQIATPAFPLREVMEKFCLAIADYHMAILLFDNPKQKSVAYSNCGRCYTHVKMHREAIDCLEKAIVLYPNEYDYYECAKAYVNLATEQNTDEAKGKAIAYFCKAGRIDATNDLEEFLTHFTKNEILDCIKTISSSELVKSILKLCQSRNHPLGKKMWAKEGPRTPTLTNSSTQQQIARFLDSLDSGFSFSPPWVAESKASSYEEAHALFLSTRFDFGSVINICNKAIASNPRDIQFYFLRAQCYQEKRNSEAAFVDYELCLRLNKLVSEKLNEKSLSKIHLRLGNIYYQYFFNHFAAIERFTNLLSTNPQDAAARYARAKAYESLSRRKADRPKEEYLALALYDCHLLNEFADFLKQHNEKAILDAIYHSRQALTDEQRDNLISRIEKIDNRFQKFTSDNQETGILLQSFRRS